MANSIYEEYQERYARVIRKSIGTERILKGDMPEDLSIVKEHVWISMRFLTDRGIEPWEKEFEELVSELESKGETKLLDAIERTIKEFFESDKNSVSHMYMPVWEKEKREND